MLRELTLRKKADIIIIRKQFKDHLKKIGHILDVRFYSIKLLDKDTQKYYEGHFIKCKVCKKEFVLKRYVGEDSVFRAESSGSLGFGCNSSTSLIN